MLVENRAPRLFAFVVFQSAEREVRGVGPLLAAVTAQLEQALLEVRVQGAERLDPVGNARPEDLRPPRVREGAESLDIERECGMPAGPLLHDAADGDDFQFSDVPQEVEREV